VKKPSGAKATLSLNELLEDVLALAEVDSKVNRTRVVFMGANDLPTVYGDEVQIQQVALNLIRNAMESTAAAQSTRPVEVSTFFANGRVGFRVRDFGLGLAKEVEEQLFSPFVTSKEGGMGIGLSVSQTIMQGHGGDIAYEPNPGGGAVFCCEFPVAQDPALTDSRDSASD